MASKIGNWKIGQRKLVFAVTKLLTFSVHLAALTVEWQSSRQGLVVSNFSRWCVFPFSPSFCISQRCVLKHVPHWNATQLMSCSCWGKTSLINTAWDLKKVLPNSRDGGGDEGADPPDGLWLSVLRKWSENPEKLRTDAWNWYRRWSQSQLWPRAQVRPHAWAWTQSRAHYHGLILQWVVLLSDQLRRDARNLKVATLVESGLHNSKCVIRKLDHFKLCMNFNASKSF